MTPTRVYLSLLALLALTAGLAAFPLGVFGVAASLAIGLAKTLLIALFFMKLQDSPQILKLAAGAAVVWILILFSITFADYLTRGAHGVLGK